MYGTASAGTIITSRDDSVARRNSVEVFKSEPCSICEIDAADIPIDAAIASCDRRFRWRAARSAAPIPEPAKMRFDGEYGTFSYETTDNARIFS